MYLPSDVEAGGVTAGKLHVVAQLASCTAFTSAPADVAAAYLSRVAVSVPSERRESEGGERLDGWKSRLITEAAKVVRHALASWGRTTRLCCICMTIGLVVVTA